MNSKAIKRQLLAAIAMVLVAAIALGSSTYAWFVASGTVTATGMKVQAQSEGGLVIRYNDGKWGTIANAEADTATAHSLYAISTADLVSWYHASAKSIENYEAEASTRDDFSSKIFNDVGIYLGNENGYVLMQEFEIASSKEGSDSAAKGLYVSGITATGASKTFSTSMRVGVKCTYQNSTEYHIYGPVTLGPSDMNNATNNYNVYKPNGDVAGTVTFAEYTETGSKLVDETVSIPYLPTEENPGVKVQIYIWFEGEDHNLYTEQFKAETISISVDFSSMSGGYKKPTTNP